MPVRLISIHAIAICMNIDMFLVSHRDTEEVLKFESSKVLKWDAFRGISEFAGMLSQRRRDAEDTTAM